MRSYAEPTCVIEDITEDQELQEDDCATGDSQRAAHASAAPATQKQQACAPEQRSEREQTRQPEPEQLEQQDQVDSSISTPGDAADEQAGPAGKGQGGDDAPGSSSEPPAPSLQRPAGAQGGAQQQDQQQHEGQQQPEQQPEPQQRPAEPWAPASDSERAAVESAESLKREGNELYAQERYEDAMAKYQEALDASPDAAPQRAIYYANMAACSLKLKQPQLAAEQCSCALRVDDGYVKALMRRATAFEELDDLDHALADVNKALGLNPSNRLAAATAARLAPIVKERQEKLKDEMLGKLKDLGNTILGKFGLSLDNFKAEQDPASGGYSIRFQQ